MPVNLTAFDDAATRLLADQVRGAVQERGTLEAAARTLCGDLYRELHTDAGERACLMVRSYTTLAYGELPTDLQRFAKRAFGAVAITPPQPDMRCLVLLATAGDEPAWNDRRASQGHQAIPLPSPHIIARAPMIAQLVRELGLDLAHVVRPVPGMVRGLRGDAYGVFHVEEAAGSPYIPAQAEFVERYGVRSVLGFGGALASGELFATILFARVGIPVRVADRFRAVALEVRECVGECVGGVFDPEPQA